MEWLWLTAAVTAVIAGVVFTLRRREVVYEWDSALLYVDGRFTRTLAPGRHWLWPLGRKLAVHRVPAYPQTSVTAPTDVITSDGFVLRLAASSVYRITDARAVVEGQNQHQGLLVLALAEAMAALVSERTLTELLQSRASLGDEISGRMEGKVAGLAVDNAFVSSVTLPPETRRMMTEAERAKHESHAAIERARGEQAALRSLANAARMLKDNPELMKLRLLQAVSPGGKGATLVLGQDALGSALQAQQAS